VYSYEQITLDGIGYEIRHLRQEFDAARPRALSVRPIDPAYPTLRDGWWNVDLCGRVYWSYQRTIIPNRLAEACKLWMSTDGYQDMSLRDFLTSLGVLE